MESPEQSPSSSLLQDLLREKKAERRRSSKVYDMDIRRATTLGEGANARDVQSSPIPPNPNGREDFGHKRRSSAVGGRNASEPKGMGMREMEQYIQKITKENFDLKLELFHRRQRHEKLEAEVIKLQHLEEENQDLHSANEELLKELEKRDEAVKEAVNLICELEGKVESINQTSSNSSKSVQGPGSSRATPATIRPSGAGADKETPSLSPPRLPAHEQLPPLPDLTLPATTKGPWRTPSFLREEKPSTTALRSLYQNDHNPSTFSLNRAGSPQHSADPDTFTLNSPRLSVLSESSFMSVYGKSPKLSPDPTQDVKVSPTRTSADRVVKNQTDGLAPISTDTNQKPLRRLKSQRDSSSPNKRSEHRSETSFMSRIERMTENSNRDSSSNRSEQLSKWLEESVSADESSPLRHRSSRQPRRSSGRSPVNDQFSSISEVLGKPRPRTVSRNTVLPNLAKPMFPALDVLPPTPDTMSTAQKTSSSTQSIIAEKSLYETTRPSKYASPLPSSDDERPHTRGSLGLEFENDIDHSDGEQHSGQVQQSEADTNTVPPDAFDSFPFMGIGDPSKAVGVLGREEQDVPSRPPLTTNPALSSEGNGHSRALSYPTPISSGHRTSSVQTYTPPRRQSMMRTATSPLSAHHREWRNSLTANSSATPTPSSGLGLTKTENQSKSPPLSPTPPRDAAAFVAADLRPASRESKLPRTASSRLKTLFRRSNSHAMNPAVVMAMLNGGAATESKIARPVSAEGRPGGGGGVDRSKSGRAFLGRKG
ncbi:MAG: hypothetical protein Q9191_006819 [Dirinaria sp. TL-2023a]